MVFSPKTKDAAQNRFFRFALRFSSRPSWRMQGCRFCTAQKTIKAIPENPKRISRYGFCYRAASNDGTNRQPRLETVRMCRGSFSSSSIFGRIRPIVRNTVRRELSLSLFHTASKICSLVNDPPGCCAIRFSCGLPGVGSRAGQPMASCRAK